MKLTLRKSDFQNSGVDENEIYGEVVEGKLMVYDVSPTRVSAPARFPRCKGVVCTHARPVIVYCSVSTRCYFSRFPAHKLPPAPLIRNSLGQQLVTPLSNGLTPLSAPLRWDLPRENCSASLFRQFRKKPQAEELKYILSCLLRCLFLNGLFILVLRANITVD